MVRLQMSNELKIAKKLSDIVSDVRLDLDLVGVYLAEIAPNVSYRRLSILIDSAEAEKERQIDRASFGNYTLFD